MPPYYVTVLTERPRAPVAVVHLTVSGASVATIRPSLPGRDDRRGDRGRGRPDLRPRRAGAARGSRKDGSTVLPVPAGFLRPARRADPAADVGGGREDDGRLALSPDGTRLAIAVAPGGGVQQVRLYPVTAGRPGPGRARAAPSAAPSPGRCPGPHRSQRTLAFNWGGRGQTQSARLLDLGNAGGSLLAASRRGRWPTRRIWGRRCTDADRLILTPDGSAIVCASGEITKIAKERDHHVQHRFPEFSAATDASPGCRGTGPEPAA